MLLNDLDLDVLRVLAGFVAQSRKVADILNLALTCRHLYTASRSFIPSHLRLGIPSTTFDLFQRSLAEDPTYGLGVYALKTKWCDADNGRDLNGIDIRHFFQQIPNLKFLDICNGTLNIVMILLNPETSLHMSLQWLNIYEGTLTASTLLDIMRLPQLQRLEIQNVLHYKDEDTLPKEFQNLKFRVLKFHKCQIRRQTLAAMIKSSPSLATLSCKVPLDGFSGWDHLHNTTFIGSALSPGSLLSTFITASKTLVELSLYIGSQRWQGHDGTRLDLSNFTALRRLSASAELFVGPHSLGITRNGLYSLLPRSLRSLKVSKHCKHSYRKLLLTEVLKTASFWIQHRLIIRNTGTNHR
jgi:hypothetical protein